MIRYEILIKNGKNKIFGDVTEKLEVTNIKCNCNKQLNFKLDLDKKAVVCQECGKTVACDKVRCLKTQEEIRAEENEENLKNLHLQKAWTDIECGHAYYMLTARVDYDVWKKISHYFTYYTRRTLMENEMESFDFFEGWATAQPGKVEEILINLGLIKEENKYKTLEKEEEIRQKELQEKRKQEKEQKRIEREQKRTKLMQIRELFGTGDNYKVLNFYECPTFEQSDILLRNGEFEKYVHVDNKIYFIYKSFDMDYLAVDDATEELLALFKKPFSEFKINQEDE